MLKHADMLEQGKTARDTVAQFMTESRRRRPTMQQLASRVIGGKMDKGEALWRAIANSTKELAI